MMEISFTPIQYIKTYQSRLLMFLEKCLPESGRELDIHGCQSFYLDIEHCFQGFWCMFDEKSMIGTVAIRKMDNENCELKSLYLLEQYHGRGYGRRLLQTAVDFAKEQGYQRMYLDTLSTSKKAISLYRKMGFEDTEKYFQSVRSDVFMVLDLKKSDNERRSMLKLRDMLESDIEDYVRWFTTETEWGNWDAPWEEHFEGSEEEERKGWTEYYESVKNLPDEVVRWKFEIECDGAHIGWICAYTDLGYMENPEEIWALGLDIPCLEGRKRGNGTLALQMYIEYLKEHGHKSFYTQTWSGNLPMVRVAEKLGFQEVCRKKDYWEVRGKKYDAITWRLDF